MKKLLHILLPLAFVIPIACTSNSIVQPVTKNGPVLIANQLNEVLDSLDRQAEEVPEIRKGCQKLRALSQQVHHFAQIFEKHTNLKDWSDSAEMRKIAREITELHVIPLQAIYWARKILNEDKDQAKLGQQKREALTNVLKADEDITGIIKTTIERFQELEEQVIALPKDSIASTVTSELRKIERDAKEQVKSVDKKYHNVMSKILLMVGLSRMKL